MLSSKEYKELEKKYYMQVVNRMPPVLVRGQGTEVFDNEDNSYLDFTAGWAVLNVGHNHPKVTKAIQDQASKILQMSNLFYTTPQLPLAKILIENGRLKIFLIPFFSAAFRLKNVYIFYFKNFQKFFLIYFLYQ